LRQFGALCEEAYPAIEVERYHKVRDLEAMLHDMCRQEGLSLGAPEYSLTRWMQAQKLIEEIDSDQQLAWTNEAEKGNQKGNGKKKEQNSDRPKNDATILWDPLIPISRSGRDPVLEFELQKAGVEAGKAESIVARLKHAATEAVRKISVFRANYLHDLQGQKTSGNQNDQNVVPQAVLQSEMVLISYQAHITVRISKACFDKLRRLYRVWQAAHGRAEKTDQETEGKEKTGNEGTTVWNGDLHIREPVFLSRLFCMVLRYQSLGGESYQAALPDPVFDYLSQELGVKHECFASPLNSWEACGVYTSAFPDVDRFFGSTCDVFCLRQLYGSSGGSFEANPPFTEEMMLVFVWYVEQWMEAESNREGAIPLSFTVFIPCWKDTPAYELMRDSRFQKAFITLERGEHSYKTGSQHKSTTVSMISYSKTVVFILQNEAGAHQWPVPPDLSSTLREKYKQRVFCT